MRYFLRLIQIIYSVYAIVVFLLLMLMLFPLVIIAGSFGEAARGSMVYYIVTFWSDAAMLLWGMQHTTIYGASYCPDHPAIFVFNHISYIDIPVLLKSLRHQRIRILAKAEIAKVPIFGFVYKSAAILVDRSSIEGRAKSVNKLKAALKKGISIAIAPEGTFNETNKPLAAFYDGAFRIAIETQTPIRPIIFLHTNERLSYKSIFSFTPGRTRSFFLEEVEVNGYNLTDIDVLKQKVHGIMETALIENKASWITA